MDLFSTNVLMGVVRSLITPMPALLGRYFTTEFTDTSEEIHFDVIPGKRRVAPFVSPLVPGKAVDSLGQQVKTFTPAYIKDKRRFNPNRGLKRAVGEQIGGALTPTQRMQLALATELQDQIDMITRRLEVMASEALRTGKVTIVGEDYPAVTVDFGRNAAHTLAPLTSTARWGQSAAVPLKNLKQWAKIPLQTSGVFPVDVIMGIDAWENFAEDPKIEKRLEALNTSGINLAQSAQPSEGLHFKGTIDGFNIFSYAGWYVDPLDGNEKEIFPSKAVLMTSTLVEGVRAFGAIQDEEVGLTAMPFAPKSWVDKDPAVRWLMMQSAPLTVPTRIDATVYNPDVVG